MSACPAFKHLLVLPHLRVQNTNAVSGPLTHGFPSMTAFVGLMWALGRKTRAAGLDLDFKAIGVVCHDHQEQVTDHYVKEFRLTRNPVDEKGDTAAIVEEGRIHLELTLVFGVCSERWGSEPQVRDADIAVVADIVSRLRIAGGTVLPRLQPARARHRPWHLDLTGTDEDRQTQFRKARPRLLPGFTLVLREDRLESRLADLQAEQPSATRLDAWLSLSRVNHRYQPAETENDGKWIHDRKGLGWIVPIPVGYGALGELEEAGSVANARDAATPFRFVESLYSIGEWVSSHRLRSPDQMLWYADSHADKGLYRCRNDYKPASDLLDELYDLD